LWSGTGENYAPDQFWIFERQLLSDEASQRKAEQVDLTQTDRVDERGDVPCHA
jgi:hypothetical protein